jgi:signal transduction histidine kinase
VDEYREMAPTRTIHLRTAHQEPVPVNVDRDRIGQVLSNYLSNALKYSPAEQPVMVGLDAEGMEARVWVHDEGPGVPLADQERIWDRFYRVAGIEPQHGSSVGLGLGLHISRSIIERHGGQVGVESVPGAGATFSFLLPVVHPA